MGNSKSHILDFNSKSLSKQSEGLLRPLPALVDQSRKVCLKELEQLLHAMLEQADDQLFDMSNNAYNNAHFEAMRLLRLKKEGLLKSFYSEYNQCFNLHLGKQSAYQDNSLEESISFENIALVEDGELEEGIAIDTMVKKSRAKSSAAIEQIRLRLDTLISDRSIAAENNPFEPAFICNAFKHASLTLDMDLESLLVIYKLFERMVTNNLEQVYAHVNQFFIDKGVLPDLKNTFTKPIKTQSARTPNNRYAHQENIHQESTSEQKITENDEQVISLLQNLLSSRQASISVDEAQTEIPHMNKEQAPVNTNQLVSALTQVQSNQSFDSQNLVNVLANIKTQLGTQLAQNGIGESTQSLGQFNNDMIDIVSMLFDFILDDENLHAEIKSVIARLQIPMLKVGLVDRSFFSDKNHSARLLLNEIARAGISWNPSDADATQMLQKIESICNEIITNFKDDVHIFDNLLNDFQSFRAQSRQRAEIFERRTKEAEEGKAKAESSRSIVNKELKKICFKKHVPPAAKLMLKNVWAHVMLLERLKGQEDGWEKACNVAKLLIWSVQPVFTAVELEKLVGRIPLLVKNLRKGFNIVALSPIESSHLLESLEDTHRQIIKSAQDYIENEEKQEDILRLEPSGIVPSISAPSSTTEQANETSNEPVEIEDIGFPAEQTGEAAQKTFVESVEIKPESFELVDSLTAGSWFELVVNDKNIRCKLAARISSVGKFIFVNRNGIKVAEYFTQQLAQEYQLGRVKILDDEALFDRALESVISNLRAMKTDTL
ncbi:DUF1631 domain-containing protein [Aliikangiella sp. IMCC44653]